MMVRPKLLFLFVIVFSLFSCQEDDDLGPNFENVPALIDDKVEAIISGYQQYMPGTVIGVRYPSPTGFRYYYKAYGIANIETQEAMSDNAVFDIGSIMKVYRWMLMHRLADEGSISLDGEVRSYIANYLNSVSQNDADFLKDIRIKDLMQHGSGIIDILDVDEYMNLAYGEPDRLFSLDDMFNYLYAFNDQVSNNLPTPICDFVTNGSCDQIAPGSNTPSYSSFNHIIASKIGEIVKDSDIKTLIQDYILDALTLDNTSFAGVPGVANSPLLTPGHKREAGSLNIVYPSDINATSISSGFGWTMFSDVRDLLDLSVNIFDNTDFISQASADRIVTDYIAGSFYGVSKFGTGLLQPNFFNLQNFWGHPGTSLYGHTSVFNYRITDGLSVVVLTNGNDGNNVFIPLYQITSDIGDMF